MFKYERTERADASVMADAMPVSRSGNIAPIVVIPLTPGALAVAGQVLPVNNGLVFT